MVLLVLVLCLGGVGDTDALLLTDLCLDFFTITKSSSSEAGLAVDFPRTDFDLPFCSVPGFGVLDDSRSLVLSSAASFSPPPLSTLGSWFSTSFIPSSFFGRFPKKKFEKL